MTAKLSRRSALVAGGAVAGAAFPATATSQESFDNTAFPEFVTPWSAPPLERDLIPGTTPIRLCSWSNVTTLDYSADISAAGLVKRIRDAGYTAGNITVRPGNNPWLAAPQSEIDELRSALDEYDVLFFDVHTVVNNIHPDVGEKKKAQKLVAEACETAERVGCPMVTTHAGTKSTVSNIAPHPDNWTWETWREAVASMQQIVKDTEGMQVNLGIEAVNMTCMNNPKAHLQFIEDVGSDRVKVCLDPINMISMRNHFRTTELINECFDLLGEHIIAGHAKDTFCDDGMSVFLTEVRPGTGTMDYETLLARYSQLSWPRPLLIEHLPQDEYEPARRYIEETAVRIGVSFYG